MVKRLPNKIPKYFGYFDAYSDEFSNVFCKWETTERKSDLNNDTITIFKGTNIDSQLYTKVVSEKFSGPMVTKKLENGAKIIITTIEFIYIPFSSEKERKQKKKIIKKEFKTPLFKFDTKVKHYDFKNVHLVVRITGTNSGTVAKPTFPVIEFKEGEITKKQSDTAQLTGEYDAYICYSNKDKEIADAMCEFLEKNNLKCWIQPRNVKPNSNIFTEIQNGAVNSKYIILIYSKDANNDSFLKVEIELIIKKNNAIIPFKIDDSNPEGIIGLILKDASCITAYPDAESHFKDLIGEIK